MTESTPLGLVYLLTGPERIRLRRPNSKEHGAPKRDDLQTDCTPGRSLNISQLGPHADSPPLFNLTSYPKISFQVRERLAAASISA